MGFPSIEATASAPWIGADPGGDGNFGVAMLFDDGSFRATTVSCARQAVDWIDAVPRGAGIDAPMWWSAGLAGDRKADQWIRRTFRIPGGTVQAANSLRGAALVQGAMFAERLRGRYPGLPITEAHPKALILAQRMTDVELLRVHGITAEFATQHARDAVIAALAARQGFTGRWRRDLASDRLDDEQDPAAYHLAPMHYFWPHETGSTGT